MSPSLRKLGSAPRKGGFGIIDPVLHSPLAFLPSSTATQPPSATAFGAPTTRRTTLVRLSSAATSTMTQLGGQTARHASRATYPTCATDTHTLDSLVDRAAQGGRISLELHQVPTAGAWLVVDPAHLSLAGTPTSPGRPCNTASAHLSSIKSTSATTPRSAHAQGAVTAETVRWPRSRPESRPPV